MSWSDREEEIRPRTLASQIQESMKGWVIEAKEEAMDGDVYYMEQYALMRLYGYGCEQSFNVAIRWYEEAMKKGSPWAAQGLENAKRMKAEAEAKEKAEAEAKAKSES